MIKNFIPTFCCALLSIFITKQTYFVYIQLYKKSLEKSHVFYEDKDFVINKKSKLTVNFGTV